MQPLDVARANGHASTMRPLPLRPMILVPVWIALFAASSAASFAGPPLADLAYTPTLLAILLLHIVWTWQAARFAAGVLASHDQAPRARRFDLTANILALAGATGAALFLVAMPHGLSSAGPTTLAILPVALPLAVLPTFALYATASAALCAAERVVGGGSPHVLGTFIQFFYLILAAPFLHRRLARLNDAGATRPI